MTTSNKSVLFIFSFMTSFPGLLVSEATAPTTVLQPIANDQWASFLKPVKLNFGPMSPYSVESKFRKTFVFVYSAQKRNSAGVRGER